MERVELISSSDLIDIMNGVAGMNDSLNKWSLGEIVANNKHFGVINAGFDGYFSLLVECENKVAIKNLYKFLINEGFDLNNNYNNKGIRFVKNEFGLDLGKEKETKIKRDKSGYYFDFVPENDKIETLYEFMALYEEKILKISQEYKCEIKFSFLQLDDAIKGKIIFKDICEGNIVLSSYPVVRHLYIISRLAYQIGRTEEELNEMGLNIQLLINEKTFEDLTLVQ